MSNLHIVFSRPGTLFLQGDKVSVSVFNPSGLKLEVFVVQFGAENTKKSVSKYPWVSNPCVLDVADQVSRIQVFAREINEESKPSQSNAIWANVVEANRENNKLVEANRDSEHRIAGAIQSSSRGVLTLHDPWVLPGNSVGLDQRKWFATHVMEGLTSLYNMNSDYYFDPFSYLLKNIDELREKGYQFITWHDVIDSNYDSNAKNVILQFDIDGGPKSFLKVSEAFQKRDIRATAMLHYYARNWYSYDLSETDKNQICLLENIGWAIGYHNNSLTNLIAFEPERALEPEVVAAAQADMLKDIESLRRHFNIRTLTHHGGNLYNRDVAIPPDAEITCVDKSFSPGLWKNISRSYSDGGFLARPIPLHEFVKLTHSETIFIRCHPLKYGNFPDGIDAVPITSKAAYFEDVSRSTNDQIETLSQKQKFWIESRFKSRQGVQLGYASTNKSLSSSFLYTEQISLKIKELRSRRRPDFLRQYPWQEGDPRVNWWRVLSSFAKNGTVLNVGAMPPGQKDETEAFLHPDCEITELDIDPKREPDIVADFCSEDIETVRFYDNVLINGLPYFSSPVKALQNANKFLKPGGKLLVGAAAASHPERGGLYRPEDRPIWPNDQEIKDGASLSLQKKLWSFSDESLAQLEESWQGEWQCEFMNNYWFVVATKSDDN